MDLSGIISISGRPGLYKVIAQGKNNIIVEALVDNKRIPAYASDRISALDDISIYTYEGEKPLKEILTDMFAKNEGKEGLSHKEDISTLQAYLTDILPDYDEERVYASDIKKLFQWYNMLLKFGVLVPEEPVKEEKTEEESKAPKKVAAKKPAANKAPAKKEGAKPAKKAAPKKKEDTK